MTFALAEVIQTEGSVSLRNTNKEVSQVTKIYFAFALDVIVYVRFN